MKKGKRDGRLNHGLKAFLLAAATIITCIVVSLGFSMAREAKQIGNHVVEELHQYRVNIEEQDYTKYDGVTVYGNDVVNLMKRELREQEGGVWITVVREDRQVTYKKREETEGVKQIGNRHYIAPAERYTGEVVRNENEVIVELIFRRTEETEETGR